MNASEAVRWNRLTKDEKQKLLDLLTTQLTHSVKLSKKKLDDVHDRQERCRIVEQELVVSKQKLERDCAKARTYQELKEKIQLGTLLKTFLIFIAGLSGLLLIGNNNRTFQLAIKNNSQTPSLLNQKKANLTNTINKM